MKFYAYLKKNPELEIKITEARKYGVQTLIDKLLEKNGYKKQLEELSQFESWFTNSNL